MVQQSPRLKPITIPNLRDTIEHQVREAILTGVFQPGERIVESTVADELNVSRTSVREVMTGLEREGLVVSIPRRGYLVVDFTDKDVEEVYGVRLILEVGALQRAMDRLTNDQLDHMQQTVDAIGQAASQGADHYELAELDMQFHEVICKAADNSRLYSTWNAMRWQTQLLIGLTAKTHDAFPAQHEQYHKIILAAIRAGDREKAETALTAHIANGEQRAYEALKGPLKAQERTTTNGLRFSASG